MYTSYEERLSLLQLFHQGAEAFQAKIPEAVIKKGDGWKLASIGSRFGMFNSFTLRDELIVRRLVENDLDEMCVIYKDVYTMSDEMIHDMKKMLLASENDYTYGLFQNNEMVSLVTAMVFQDSVGIWSMGTPTSHQKNGYGQQLLMHVMKTHKDMGAKNFYLHATSAGKFLYDKAGWMTLDYLPYFSKPKTQ